MIQETFFRFEAAGREAEEVSRTGKTFPVLEEEKILLKKVVGHRKNVISDYKIFFLQ